MIKTEKIETSKSKKSTTKTFLASDKKNKKVLSKETQLFFKALQKN